MKAASSVARNRLAGRCRRPFRAVSGDRRSHPFAPVGTGLVGLLDLNVARQDRVDGDTKVGELDRRRPQKAELRRLGRAVMRPTGKPGDRTGDRGRDDDPPAPAARELGTDAVTASIVPLTFVAKIALTKPTTSAVSRFSSTRPACSTWTGPKWITSIPWKAPDSSSAIRK